MVSSLSPVLKELSDVPDSSQSESPVTTQVEGPVSVMT